MDQNIPNTDGAPASKDQTDVGKKSHHSKKNNETEAKIVEIKDKESEEEEEKRVKEALKLIQNQDIHALYCPNCTRNITQTVQLFKETEAPFPYDQKTWVLWVPFVFPFSFIWRWFTRDLPEQNPSKQTAREENIVRTRVPSWFRKEYLMYLLVVVLPLLLWALPSSNKKPGLPSLPNLPIHFPRIKYLPVILLFPLAALALAWWLKKGLPTTLTLTNPFQQLPSIEIDILKSIVYGGLIESITSLGVVSSAAGSGASTLNVLALGLANLFSGFFLICHNLYVLIRRPPYQGENHDNMPNLAAKYQDQYEVLLGKKKMALLHSIVVLVSLLIFAVIPPLLYAFSYKIIGKEHSKAVVALAVSLLCVISLSFAKAYAFRMENKLKTVAEYTVIAIVASALSFLAGQYLIHVFGSFDLH